MTPLTLLLNICGLFAVVLGFLHFTFPEKFGFAAVLPKEGVTIPPFRLAFYSYEMKCSDLRGIIYVMNHCVSYVILVSGVFDLFAQKWLGTFPGSLAACLIGGFWLMRAGTQLYLGRRRGDWFVIAWFCLLGGLHLVAAINRNTSSAISM
jgi:hypothetical protein